MKKTILSFLLLAASLFLVGCAGVKSQSPLGVDCSIYKPPQETNPVCIGGS
jgi:outer membrane biogenesis lipoprotein LolB